MYIYNLLGEDVAEKLGKVTKKIGGCGKIGK